MFLKLLGVLFIVAGLAIGAYGVWRRIVYAKTMQRGGGLISVDAQLDADLNLFGVHRMSLTDKLWPVLIGAILIVVGILCL